MPKPAYLGRAYKEGSPKQQNDRRHVLHGVCEPKKLISACASAQPDQSFFLFAYTLKEITSHIDKFLVILFSIHMFL